MRVGDMANITNPLFRKDIAHTWYVDQNFPEVGFLTRDEAAILFNAALPFGEQNALEIGAHVGWSTVHLALANLNLDTIEPQLKHDPRVLLHIITSLRSSNIYSKVNLVAGFSAEEVEKLGQQNKRWSFAFIDGNHNGDYPLNDAKIVSKYMNDTAMVFFHDMVFPDVARGLEYFMQNGWQTRIYHTQQIMGCAWRGRCEPPQHQPDPRYKWDLPRHLDQYYNFDGSSRYL